MVLHYIDSRDDV